MILFLFSSLCEVAGAQNIIRILPGDTPDQIVRKAALVRPSERQIAWQELEFTVFFHFGMNTFTDREWGVKGTPPSMFDPSTLDAEQWITSSRDSSPAHRTVDPDGETS